MALDFISSLLVFAGTDGVFLAPSAGYPPDTHRLSGYRPLRLCFDGALV